MLQVCGYVYISFVCGCLSPSCCCLSSSMPRDNNNNTHVKNKVAAAAGVCGVVIIVQKAAVAEWRWDTEDSQNSETMETAS